MPIISSTYKPPRKIFRNADVSTLYSGLIRKVEGVKQTRERISLPDGDFLDLEWSYAKKPSKNCVIALHGLEGNASRPYILGTAKIFNENNFDCCAVNYRGCSGEDNKAFGAYHSGKTEDLQAVIQHILSKNQYKKLVLNGFSLGGNLALKFCSEHPLPKEIKAVIAVSTPVDLEGCMWMLKRPRNFIYSKKFLIDLKQKLELKVRSYPDLMTKKRIKSIKTLKAFDDVYTSKAHGFADAIDYYTRNSAKQFLNNIEIPTLIINAKNDSFLSESCYPIKEAEENENITLEIPDYGGHVGFVDANNIYYNEKRAIEFVKTILSTYP